MENNFYNYFNCNDKEELYSLIKDQDESVKELVDYIEYAKENILERNYKITNQSQLEEAFRMGDIINPGSDEISIIFLDSSNNIINNKVFNNETSLEDIMLESYSPVAKSFILINGENGTKKALQLGDDLNTIGFTEIDILSKEKDNIFFSKLGGESKEFGEPQKRETPYNFSKEINKLEKMESYQEFMKFYINNEIIGKNILYQSEEIGELLKISNQKLTQEEFILLQHDKNYNVISCEAIFKVGLDRATVDLKTILPKIFKKDVEGISIAHNHPSGNSKPSRADIELTSTLEKMCKKLNKNLLDHYVVSKSEVFSFLKEGLIDDKYLKNLKNIDDKNILTEIIKKDWSKIKYMNPELIEKDIALKAVSENGFAFNYIPEKLKNDRDIVLTTIKNKDSEIALFAVKQEASNYLFLDKEFKENKEVIEDVLKNGNNLVLFDDKYRNNPEIVEMAIKNNPESIKYASKELQEQFQLKKEEDFTIPMKKKSNNKGMER